MMMSPDFYYESEVQGKAANVIWGEIHSLQRDKARFKRIVERPGWELTRLPDEKTMLGFTREYLQMAVKALEEAGECYHPTEEEISDAAFNDDMPLITEMTLVTNRYGNGYAERKILINGDSIFLLVRLSPEAEYAESTYSVSRNRLFEELQRIHIGEWKPEYKDLSGKVNLTWSLEISYDDSLPGKKFSGCGAAPFSFDELCYLMTDPYI